jgi:hypothetical protein
MRAQSFSVTRIRSNSFFHSSLERDSGVSEIALQVRPGQAGQRIPRLSVTQFPVGQKILRPMWGSKSRTAAAPHSNDIREPISGRTRSRCSFSALTAKGVLNKSKSVGPKSGFSLIRLRLRSMARFMTAWSAQGSLRNRRNALSKDASDFSGLPVRK